MLLLSDAARIPLADKSIHAVCCSPPYWGLRKYSGEQGRIWGGDHDCVHEWGKGIPLITTNKPTGLQSQGTIDRRTSLPVSNFCQLCSAWYGGLGLEPTPDLFIQHMVEIFREVRRVLRDDGVVWINLGDCFAGGGKGGGRPGDKQWTNLGSRIERPNAELAQGNLMLMPHRVAIALQDDGWVIRQDLVWHKRNPMPESVNGWRFEREKEKISSASNYDKDHSIDGKRVKRTNTGLANKAQYEYGEDYELKKGSWRHTRAHEYVFQLTKQMGYWSNQEAVREKAEYGRREIIGEKIWAGAVNNMETRRITQTVQGANPSAGRNPRSVLDVPTAPYKNAHYATYPPNLIAPLIRATCPRWACPVCGQGWSPVVEKSGGMGKSWHDHSNDNVTGQSKAVLEGKPITNVKEYRPTCDHPHTIEEAVPGIVLDPFIGSGTTGAVARELQLRWIGLDISFEYLDMQAKIRTKTGSPSNELEGLPLFERGNEDVG